MTGPGARMMPLAFSANDVLGEQTLKTYVNLLVRLVEAAGAIVIFLGAAIAIGRCVLIFLRRRPEDGFVGVRLGLGRFLALGLEFQLAGDILHTAIAPTFRELGQLAAIAAIRTALNFFLGRELREERAEVLAERRAAADLPVSSPAGR